MSGLAPDRPSFRERLLRWFSSGRTGARGDRSGEDSRAGIHAHQERGGRTNFNHIPRGLPPPAPPRPAAAAAAASSTPPRPRPAASASSTPPRPRPAAAAASSSSVPALERPRANPRPLAASRVRAAQIKREIEDDDVSMADAPSLDDASSSPPAAAASSSAPKDAPARAAGPPLLPDVMDDVEEEKVEMVHDDNSAYQGGLHAVLESRHPAQQALAQPVNEARSIQDGVLRRLYRFLAKLSIATGCTVNNVFDWSRFGDDHGWEARFHRVQGRSFDPVESERWRKARDALKVEFEKEVFQRLIWGRFSLMWAFFWIQNRLGHPNIRLWDVIHSKTWSQKLLDVVEVAPTVNDPHLRREWQLETMQAKYLQLRTWFDKCPEMASDVADGEAPEFLPPLGDVGLRPMNATVPLTDTEMLFELKMHVITATEDSYLTDDQLSTLVEHALRTYFAPGTTLLACTRVIHARVVFAHILSIDHALSNAIYANRRAHRLRTGRARIAQAQSVFLTDRKRKAIEWMRNFLKHGCACTQ